jgi:hypothetical protein
MMLRPNPVLMFLDGRPDMPPQRENSGRTGIVSSEKRRKVSGWQDFKAALSFVFKRLSRSLFPERAGNRVNGLQERIRLPPQSLVQVDKTS